MNDVVVFNDFCSEKLYKYYIRWNFGEGDCCSCKLIGQSYNILEYPRECPFIDEIKEYENLHKESEK